MSYPSRLCLVFLLLALPVIGAAKKSLEVAQPFQLHVPGHVIHYAVPASLELGYGGLKNEQLFEGPLHSSQYGPFGPDAVQAAIGTFYQGVKGDFRDWDLSIVLFVAKFTAA